jgi:hypothetical protein
VAQVVRLTPTLLRELLLRAAARLDRAASRTPRRAEIEQLTRWLRDPVRRGRRLIGAVELERSRSFVALYDAQVATPNWRFEIGVAREAPADLGGEAPGDVDVRWVPGDGNVAVRPLAAGDNLSRFAAALAPAERRAWPAVTVGSRIVWVPRLWITAGCRRHPFPGAVRVVVRGLPDLRRRHHDAG